MAHNSKYFSQLLQICTFAKLNMPQCCESIPEAIKLMTIDQLYANIMHDKFETKLIKQIIVLILQKVQNSRFEKSMTGGAKHFLIEKMSKEKDILFDHYYVQMAIQQYLTLAQSQLQHKKYVDNYCFYNLDIDFKFKLLSTLARNANQTLVKQKLSKTKEKDNQDKKEQVGSKNTTNLSQMIVLGDDGDGLYLFFPFMPAYVARMELGKWELLDKKTVLKLIQNLLIKQQSTQNLALIENLGTLYQKFMIVGEKEIHIRFHQIKQDPLQKERKRVKILKAKLLNINQRYEIYLKNYDNKRWGYLTYRQNYVENVQKAVYMRELIESFRDFYICSAKTVYKCLASNEKDIPEHDAQKYYQPIKKQFCNINTVCNSLGNLKTLRVEDVALKLIQDEPTDSYALFQFLVLWLESSLSVLQEKARKYYEKVRRMKLAEQKEKEKEKQKQENKKQNGKKMELRKKQKKMFGVTMLDSDDQQLSFISSSSRIQNNFATYEYKTRNRNI